MCPRAFSLAAPFTLNFYNNMHPYYGGIDLHARILYVCIIDPLGEILVHKEISANSQKLHQLLEPYMGNIVVGVEQYARWYWVSDKVNAVGREGALRYFWY